MFNSASLTLDALYEGGWNVFRCKKAQTIRYVDIRSGVSAMTVGGVIRVGIAMLDALGHPDVATAIPVWAGATGNGYADVTFANAEINTWKTGTLTEDVTLVVGTYYAVGAYIQNFTTQNMTLARAAPWGEINNRYVDTYGAGAWIKSIASSVAATMRAADGTPHELGVGLGVVGNAYGSGSANNEYGNYFQVPVPLTVCGLAAVIDTDRTYTARLYQGADTVLATATIGDVSVQRAGTSGALSEFAFDSGAEVTLYTGIWYRLAIQFTHVGTSTLYVILAMSKTHLGVYGFTDTMYQTSRTYGVGNAWTEVESQRVAMCLLVSGQPAGGASGRGFW